ncbi:unnamed protein product [Diatraea saccharalis]|uniref:Aminopeptidase n=1 Tax=Diatraea saccharalis TaxID=40085 RepID=A0A9N9WJB4_9NEOP|nr:unnamed protein product [Diatraea saccharalis]
MNKTLFILIILVKTVVNNGYKILSQKIPTEFWDESEPFGNFEQPSPDLRLPAYVVPSFYRLKLHIDLENSNFTGEVYITIRASQPVKEIILHSKDLSINSNARLTEQIYERVETFHSKSKREVNLSNETMPTENNILNVTSTMLNENTTTNTQVTITTTAPSTDMGSQNISETTAQPMTETAIPSIDTQVTHSSVRNIKILSITEASGDRLILKLESALSTNVDYTLQITFSGQISNSLTGFYKSSYTDSQQMVKKLGATQFEPTSARAAFPCFDEPAFKAMFEISIAHPDSINVLSNMKVSTQEVISDEPGWKWTHFERSVNMSTYLVAYVLSDFQSLETSYLSKDNITKSIRVWTRPALISKAKYALNITPKLLSYYEDVFGVPYALDKVDLVAVPDFSSGAMENWGLITFRETTLLFDEVDGVPRERQNVAIDVAHELAHQWFGNLVTMRWWTDLWLNEGFATYIEYIGVDYIEPKWNMFETFVRDKMELLRSDALKNTSPVSRQVIDASEISQKFDEISYNKGANLIRMLNHTISGELFHKGLVIYLNDWKYTNAEENDLWQAMSKATSTEPSLQGVSIVEMMNTWTRQAGYPVLNVTRDYYNGQAEFHQRLFSSTKDPYSKMLDQLWYIPISYAVIDSPQVDWTTKPKLWLTNRRKVTQLPINSSEALYVNVDAIGYYRVNYDKKNWELLNAALKSGRIKSPIAKAQLIDDSFNLAKVAQLEYSYALGLTTCVANGEDSRIVWDMLLNNMNFLKHNLKATSGYVYFQDYMRMILKTQLERLNYGLNKPKDDNEAFLAENLVMWECVMESPRCLSWARNLFDAWMNQTDIKDNPIPNYLRSLVYSVALKYGGRREFDFMWRVFIESTDPNVKSLAINTLPSTRDEALITTLLEKSLTEIPKQYAVAAWSVESPVGTRLAQQFLINNFDRVHSKFSNMDSFMFPAVLSGAFGGIYNEDELNELKSLAVKHKQQLLPMSQTLQKLIDTATLRIAWLQRYAADINAWFKNYVTNARMAHSTTPSSGASDITASSSNTTATLPDFSNTPTVSDVDNTSPTNRSANVTEAPPNL